MLVAERELSSLQAGAGNLVGECTKMSSRRSRQCCYSKQGAGSGILNLFFRRDNDNDGGSGRSKNGVKTEYTVIDRSIWGKGGYKVIGITVGPTFEFFPFRYGGSICRITNERVMI